MTTDITINFNKRKLNFLLVIAIILSTIGYFLFQYPEKFTSIFMKNKTIIYYTGIIALIFFSCCSFIIFQKIFTKKTALKISKEGITDNIFSNKTRFITKSHITNIEIISIRSTKLISLTVNNPEDYINKEKNSFLKKMLESNYNLYGSPITINSNSLNISTDKLAKLLKEYIKS